MLCEEPLLSFPLPLQALENEAIQLLGVLADVNPRVLTAIEGMALELGSNKGKESGPWVSVLVSQNDVSLALWEQCQCSRLACKDTAWLPHIHFMLYIS